MFFIVFLLDLAAALCLVNGFSHGIGDRISIHDHMAFGVSGGTADGLDQGSFRTEKSLFICIQNGNQRDLRDIQTFTQKVDDLPGHQIHPDAYHG